MTTETPREPDLLDEVARIAPVVFNVLEVIQRVQASGRLSTAKSDVALWQERAETQRRLCSETARCADVRCRRKRYCRKLKWIDPMAEAARARLAHIQAELRASAPQDEPSSKHGKKGRTGVRP